MPIVFEQPQPLQPDVSRAYGSAQQWAQDIPILQRGEQSIADAYLRSASLAAHGGGQAMAVAAHRQEADARMQAQAQLSGEQQEHQFQMLQRQQSGQMGLQQQHAELQMMVSNNQLSQQEDMRLQRLRNAMGAVQEAVQSGSLTQEEGSDLLLQIRAGVSPLEQRKAKAQQQHLELQNKQMEQQAAFQDKLMQERQAFMAKSLHEKVGTIVDDYGNKRSVLMGMDGNIDWHATDQVFNRQGGGGGGGSRGAGGAGGGGSQPQPLTTQQLLAVGNHVDQEMRREEADWRRRVEGPENMRLPEAQREELPLWIREPARFRSSERQRRIDAQTESVRASQPAPAQETPEQRQARFQQSLRQVQQMLPGAPPNVQREMASDLMRQPTVPNAPPGQTLGLQGGPPRADDQLRWDEPQPFQVSSPQTQQQHDIVRGLQGFRGLIDQQPGLSQQQRASLDRSYQEMVSLVEQFGSVGAMPPWAVANYNAAERRLAALRPHQPRRERTWGDYIGHVGTHATNEILGAPERGARLVTGRQQRGYGDQPYRND